MVIGYLPFRILIMKKILAIIVLLLLLVVPFFNWRAGAVLWMVAWSVFMLQGLYVRRPSTGGNEKGKEERDS